jgi:hypothetical protein
VLNVVAEPNRAWQIQASSDLLTWEILATITPTSPNFRYTDTAAVATAPRFYRVGSE